MTAFDIKDQYRQLDELAGEYDHETGEIVNSDEVLMELMAELKEAKETKLNAIEYLKRENKAMAQALADEVKRLQAKKQSLESTFTRLTELQDMLLDGEKVKTDKFTFSYRTTKSVQVPDEVNPDLKEWVNVKYTWDKKKIKEDLETSGISYDEFGIKIVEKHSLSVR